VKPTCDAVRQRLSSSVGHDGPSGGVWQKPMAVAHLKAEYLSGSLMGVPGDSAVWERVEKQLNKDPRVERTKANFGNTARDAWTWTAAPIGM
jgi:hypothetical protein